MDDHAKWVGIAAIILATGVTAAMVIIALGAAWHTGPISQEESSVLSTVLGAAVGAVAAYLGVRVVAPTGRPPSEPEGAGGEDRGDTGDLP